MVRLDNDDDDDDHHHHHADMPSPSFHHLIVLFISTLQSRQVTRLCSKFYFVSLFLFLRRFFTLSTRKIQIDLS